MSELFEKNYDHRSQADVPLHSPNAVTYGLKSLKYFAGKVWNIVPCEIGNAVSLEKFSAKTKCLKTSKCPCKLRFTYIHQLRYL